MSNTIAKLTGRVKWFNNRSGFGFITIADTSATSENSYVQQLGSQDIFVHYTSLKVGSKQYMYLVQGEYVEFTLAKMPEGEKHTHQALDVTGVAGGVLMCETRMQNPRPRRYVVRSSKPTDRENVDTQPTSRVDRRRAPRYDNRRGGYDNDYREDDRRYGNREFQYVTRRRKPAQQHQQQQQQPLIL